MAKKKVNAVTLAAIVAATNAGSYVFATPAEVAELLGKGLVEQNPAVAEGDKIATRATPTGIADASAAQPATEAPKEKPTFVIEDNIAIPEVKGRGRTGTSTYPFDTMNVGQSFFVAGKEAKNLASTISSVNARYSEEIPGEVRTNRKGKEVPATKQNRYFIARSVEENGVKGSRVWRKS
jgi:hypothetical protein